MSGHPPPTGPDPLSTPYWEGTARGELVLARCERCGLLSHPPDVVRLRCHDPHVRYRFERMGGSGSVLSWVVIRQSFLPGFEVPFLLVDVAADGLDGDRLPRSTPRARGDRFRQRRPMTSLR